MVADRDEVGWFGLSMANGQACDKTTLHSALWVLASPSYLLSLESSRVKLNNIHINIVHIPFHTYTKREEKRPNDRNAPK